MKRISVVILCYNEEENVGPMAEMLVDLFRHELAVYDYELIFIDNDSQNRTREYLRILCAENHKIKAVFNTENSGQSNSPYYGMLQSTGDATVLITADFRDPPGMTVKYVAAWEEGYKITIGIKTHSVENPLTYHLRSPCYKWTRKLSEADQIEHSTGSGLYDKSFIQMLRDPDDPTPLLHGIVAGLGCRRKKVSYDQPKRRAGKTGNNLYKLYDVTMLSVTSYTKFGLCLVTFLGGITLMVSVIIALTCLVMKLLYWDRLQAELTPLLIDILFLDVVQIFLIGIVGEYVLAINQHVVKCPLVVETERLNFESEDTEKTR